MAEPLYSLDVLRLAASVADYPPLTAPDAMAERRSPTCGSRMTVSLDLNAKGQISAIGLNASACALGQAAAAILARHVIGRTADDLEYASTAWSVYLAGESEALPDWPELALLSKGRDYPARHGSMRLAFEAASAAAHEASEKTRSSNRESGGQAHGG